MAKNPRAVTLGVLRETHVGERRVALVPADVKRLASRITIYIERDAGSAAGFTDAEYTLAGAHVAPDATVASAAEVLVGIRPPTDLAGMLRPGTVVLCLEGREPNAIARLAARSILHLALERVPRTTRAQSMDVLSSQAALAGYAAVLEGARRLSVLLPMMTTAAGTIKPAKMLAVGAGVAGLQAIATARRLGAQTFGFDVREAVREQVESLGARFVAPGQDLSVAQTANGYAGEQTADTQSRIRGSLAKHLPPMQLIITSAQIPGRPAPVLIDEAAVATLKRGSVIIDLAAESGGNTALTRADETVTVGGVQILGPTNLPSTLATDASQLFSGNVRALLEHLLNKENRLVLEPGDPITQALLAGQTPMPRARAVA